MPKDDDNDGLADKWEIQMAAKWSNQYGTEAFTDAQALAFFFPNQDDELADPDGRAEIQPFDAQQEEGDAHTVWEEYRGYILDGGGLNGQGANGHWGGHIRLNPARKEILVEVDRAAVLNNLPTGGLPSILDGTAKVFSNADRGAGIYLYYLFDEVNLALPANVNNSRKDSRDTADARAAMAPNLATDFIHLLFADSGLGNSAMTRDTSVDVKDRGTIVSISEMNAKYAPGNAWGITKIDEAYMAVVAHEIIHMLFEKVSVGDFNEVEHIIEPNPAVPIYEAEVLYFKLTKLSRELATVTIHPVVQQEMKVKSNQGIV